MKQPKKLTKKIKMKLSANKLSPDEWCLLNETKTSVTIMHKTTEEIICYDKQDDIITYKQKSA